MASLNDYFSVQVFFIVLRETLELAIIISVLLAFVNQSMLDDGSTSQYKSIEGQNKLASPVSSGDTQVQSQKAQIRMLKVHIWVGGLCGFLACLVVGAIILTVFYVVGSDLWASTEHYWEGAFSILASIIISFMGIKMLRVNKMQQKWKHKLGCIIRDSKYLDVANDKSSWSEKNAMFILPFVTTLREGLEAIVFVGGIGINDNTSLASIFNSVVLAVAIGSVIGVALYRSGNNLSVQMFMIISTGFLYLVAAGLFSKGVWNFELQRFIDLCGGMDVSETGHGPGSYDINTSVWHVNCCNGEMQEDGVWWMLFTAVFGWTNSATYGSVISYNVYWVVVIAMFGALLYEEKVGVLPLIPLLWQQKRIKKRAYLSVATDPRFSTESVRSTTPLTR